ncbi:unnamed protein product, partial [Phaeothamnion confervicola]
MTPSRWWSSGPMGAAFENAHSALAAPVISEVVKDALLSRQTPEISPLQSPKLAPAADLGRSARKSLVRRAVSPPPQPSQEPQRSLQRETREQQRPTEEEEAIPRPRANPSNRWHAPLPQWLGEGAPHWLSTLASRPDRSGGGGSSDKRRELFHWQRQRPQPPLSSQDVERPRIISYLCVVAVQESLNSPRARVSGAAAPEPYILARCPADDDPARPLPDISGLCFPAGVTDA